MKKVLIIVSIFLMLLFASNINVNANYKFNEEMVSAAGGTYKVTERTSHQQLKYGLTYTKDIAESSSSNIIEMESSPRTKTSVDPQVVNVLEIPTESDVKIVNWTYSSNSKWTKATVTKLAKDFEAKNPGWVVLAGINGDFFDINGEGALQYQTTGAAVNDGEVIRVVTGGRQVGFTNDGSTNTLIGGEELSFTDYFTLSIYDANQDVIKTFTVDKFNETPVENEIAVYFSYYKFDENGARTINYATTPSENSYLVENSERSYAVDANRFYGKGIISSNNTEKQLYIGQFAVVTKNDELANYLENGTCIRIQQDIIGAYAECDSISGCGARLINNGEFDTTSDGMSNYAHPRTVIGQKADGTIVMATVDGRQFEKNMYGMTYEELSAMMMYYDCTEAYNLDGGGSTTMIIRNSSGEFDVMNSPSDGGERSDSNAIFVVVPEMKLNIDQALDTSVSLSYISKAKDIEISNVSMTITGNNYSETKQITQTSFTWEGLTPNTEYEIVYSYTMNYKGKITTNTSYPKTFKTGTSRPTLTNYYYEDLGDNYILYFTINDPSDSIINIQLRYDNKSQIITEDTVIYFIAKTDVKNPAFVIRLTYNVNAIPSSTVTDVYNIELLVEEPDIPEEPETPSKEKSKGCKSGSILIVQLLTLSTLLSVIIRKKK